MKTLENTAQVKTADRQFEPLTTEMTPQIMTVH